MASPGGIVSTMYLPLGVKLKFSLTLDIFTESLETLIFSKFQDSGGRDLKSAQNTPSRQPLAPPSQMAPPPLHQDNRQSLLAGGDFKKVEFDHMECWAKGSVMETD